MSIKIPKNSQMELMKALEEEGSTDQQEFF